MITNIKSIIERSDEERFFNADKRRANVAICGDDIVGESAHGCVRFLNRAFVKTARGDDAVFDTHIGATSFSEILRRAAVGIFLCDIKQIGQCIAQLIFSRHLHYN